MFVCCDCCLLSGRGLCDELITRPEESYRLWCIAVCVLETSWMRRPWPTAGCRSKNKQNNNMWPVFNQRWFLMKYAKFSIYVITLILGHFSEHFSRTCKLLFSHSKTSRYGMQMERQLLKLTVTRSTAISWAAWPWRQMHYNLSKRRKLDLTLAGPCIIIQFK